MEEWDDLYIAAEPPKREWQCTECGWIVESSDRPMKCPDCNFVDGDRRPGIHLFIPRDACGWFD